MKILQSETVPYHEVTLEGAAECRMRELITAADGAPTFAMRQFELGIGGNTPFHCHAWEHEVFIICGEGHILTAGGDERSVHAGDAVLVAPGEEHSFRNDGEFPMRFLCMIPVEQVCCR
jgi:quercetin dioxygenase-like cupin family protein